MEDIRCDFSMRMRYRVKYHGDTAESEALHKTLVSNVGMQSLAVVRIMQDLWRNGHAGPAKMVSRFLRHAYAMEVHPAANIAPGISFVHGNGLVISHRASIAPGCILFHNVTLGEGTHATTREVGAPTLEEDVHIGPGATLVGPIVVGRGTKIMAGAVISESIPPHSVVRQHAVDVLPRKTAGETR